LDILGTDKNSKDLFWSALILFLVGMHSILLGLFIYFFTDFFYNFFFKVSVENIFFVRQSGIFLFLAGLFYMYPLINFKKFHTIIFVVIFSKLTAVYFLLVNAKFTPVPPMMYLAAFFDGLMAVVLIVVYFRFRKSLVLTKSGIVETSDVRIKEAA